MSSKKSSITPKHLSRRMKLKSCLILISVLHMGCNPQTKSTKETTKDSDSSFEAKNSTESTNTTTKSVNAKAKQPKTASAVSVQAPFGEEEQGEITFETSEVSKSNVPTPKVTKQKIRTQSQTAKPVNFSPGSNGEPTTCESLCGLNSVCHSSDRQSFCRWDKIKPNCFGLHWKDSTQKSVCYHPTEKDCSEEYPVECGVLKPILKGKTVETVDFLTTNTCASLCKLATGCNQSVCTEQSVCSGLYWNDKKLQNRNTVIHESQLAQSLPDHQRVPCGVYNYIA